MLVICLRGNLKPNKNVDHLLIKINSIWDMMNERLIFACSQITESCLRKYTLLICSDNLITSESVSYSPYSFVKQFLNST